MRILSSLLVAAFVFAVKGANDNTCHNGGELKNGKCGCPSYFTGPLCDDPVCTNNGILNADGKTCKCPSGFTGAACQFGSCKENSHFAINNDWKTLVLIVESSLSTQVALYSLADKFVDIYNQANVAHPNWFTNINIYVMNGDGTSQIHRNSGLPQAASDFLRQTANQATDHGHCTMPIWEAIDGVFTMGDNMDGAQFILITAAIPQVNGTDITYAKNHFSTIAPTFDFIHVESDVCPMSQFKQNYTEFVNFAVSFKGIFLRSTQNNVASTIQKLLPTRHVAQRLSIMPRLPDVKCAGDTFKIQVDSQISNIYIAVAGHGSTVRIVGPDGNAVTTTTFYNTNVQTVWNFAPNKRGMHTVMINSREDLCFPVIYGDGIQVVLAFTEHMNSDNVTLQPLRVFDNFPVAQQYSTRDMLGELSYIDSLRYYMDPPTDSVVFMQSPLVPHLNCAFNWIGEDFDGQLPGELHTFIISGKDRNGVSFERAISSMVKDFDGPAPNSNVTSSSTSNPIDTTTKSGSRAALLVASALILAVMM